MTNPARSTMLVAALGLLLVGAQPGAGLTTFRIGDTADASCQDSNVRCFEWFELTDAENFGLQKEIVAPEGVLEPERLDPEVNLTPLIRDREHGWIKSSNTYGWQDEGRKDGTGLDWLFDGDVTTTYQGLPPQSNGISVGCGDFTGSFSTRCKGIWFKLGGLFPIERVVLYPSPEFETERFIPNFRIGTNDALVERVLTDMGNQANLREREGYVSWRGNLFVDFDVTHEFRENTVAHLDLPMPKTPISEIIFAGPVTSSPTWEIAEFEIYGSGFAAEASYVTELIELDDFSSLGQLTWSGVVAPGARLDLSMRTGDDTTPEIFWRWDHKRGGARTRLNEDGTPLTRFDYFGGGPDRKEPLSDGEKAGISPDKDNWEFWSPPLEFEVFQADLVGRKPRKYVQLRADFSSQVADAAGQLDFLQFAVSSPPIVTQVLAEIVPLQAPLGETTKFTYKLNPTFTAGVDLGFDSIQIFTPLAPASVDSLRFESIALGPGDFICEPFDPATGRCYDSASGSFTVVLPEGTEFIDQEVIDVVFHAAVFKVGTVFNARVFNSDTPDEVRQRVTVGDADPLFDSSSLSVIPADVGSKVISALHVTPLTPNADNANDVLDITYDLVNLDGDVPVTLSVFTLAGDLVADIPVATLGSGRFPATWDGVGKGGDLVPPGLYLLRLEVDSDSEKATALATFPVVY